MFQVIFPMPSGTGLDQLQAIMPTGWTVEPEGSWDNSRYHIIDRLNYVHVGILTVKPGKAIISVNEAGKNGAEFWHNFGMKYPELDPFDLRFGVVYKVQGEENKFELDEMPKHGQMDAEALAHYAGLNADYVSFYLGDWQAGEYLRPRTFARIAADGKLGEVKRAPIVYDLSGIENETTM